MSTANVVQKTPSTLHRHMMENKTMRYFYIHTCWSWS